MQTVCGWKFSYVSVTLSSIFILYYFTMFLALQQYNLKISRFVHVFYQFNIFIILSRIDRRYYTNTIRQKSLPSVITAGTFALVMAFILNKDYCLGIRFSWAFNARSCSLVMETFAAPIRVVRRSTVKLPIIFMMPSFISNPAIILFSPPLLII